MQRRTLSKLGEAAANSIPKVNSELLQLTYGSLVRIGVVTAGDLVHSAVHARLTDYAGAQVAQLVKDYEDPAAINVQLEKM